ncbi:MAG: asparaginase [Nocardiopsaceae bacterium]|jgi:L-asparaginase|nr:asparaginase [Nocardiopsaceae bacterium]
MAKPTVAVGSLGGTITMTSDTGSGVAPAWGAADLVAQVPGLADVASVSATTLAMLPGASLRYSDIDQALSWARSAVDAGASGAVLVQGTDTLEETSYLLELYWDRPQPLVVTGAMRAPQRAGSDGPANLLAAVATAVDPGARGLGVLVVMNDEIHAASRVCKVDAMAVDAFGSPVFGPLARLVEGSPAWGNHFQRHPPLAGQGDSVADPRVALLTTHLADSGELLTHLVEAEYDGAVIAALGVGHVSSEFANAVSTATERFVVVFASRTGAGSTGWKSYGFAGSEKDLIARGAIPAGWLTPLKARLLLWALVRQRSCRNRIAEEFAARGTLRRS